MVEPQQDSQAALAAALEHARAGRNVKAIDVLTAFIDSCLPGSIETAEAWRQLAFAHFSIANKRLRGHEARYQSALEAFGKAIAIWRNRPPDDDFAYALHNFAAMNLRAGGGHIAAIALYKEALCLLEQQPDPAGDRRIATWNHLASTYVESGQLEEAESLLQTAFAVVPAESENAGYLNETLAFLFEAKAKVLRERAQASRQGR